MATQKYICSMMFVIILIDDAGPLIMSEVGVKTRF
jgi:hypothetical protein